MAHADEIFDYYFWHPRLVGEGWLALEVTPGDKSNTPVLNKYLLDGLGRRLVLPSVINRAIIGPYRSRYYGLPDAETWDDIWVLNWHLMLHLGDVAGDLATWRYEYIGFNGFDASTLGKPPPAEVDCRVWADFESVEDADGARRAIRSSCDIAHYCGGYMVDPPTFERIGLAPGLIHEGILLGSFPQDFYRQGAEYACLIESTCHAFGGLTNFEDRRAERDEVYNAVGIV